MITLKQAKTIIGLTAVISRHAQEDALKTGKLTETQDLASASHYESVNRLSLYLATIMDPAEAAKVPA